MNNYVIGLDPDSDKPGVAVYKNGKLIAVKSLGLFNLMDLLSGMKTDGSVHAHIENVCANNSRFKKGGVKNARAATAINRSIGMVQQSQRNLEEMLNHLGISYTLHAIDSKWKSQRGKREFELVTGWKGQSNEDSRSAAYFGYLGVKR